MCRVNRHEVRSISESIWLEIYGKKRHESWLNTNNKKSHGGRNSTLHKKNKREINLKFNQVWRNKEKIILNNWKWELGIWNSTFFPSNASKWLLSSLPLVCAASHHTHWPTKYLFMTNMNKKLYILCAIHRREIKSSCLRSNRALKSPREWSPKAENVVVRAQRLEKNTWEIQ